MSEHDAENRSDHRPPEALERRRAPRVGPFLGLGAALGAVVGILLALLGPGHPAFTTAQVTGYMLVVSAIVGTGIAAVLVLFLDRRSVARRQRMRATTTDLDSKD